MFQIEIIQSVDGHRSNRFRRDCQASMFGQLVRPDIGHLAAQVLDRFDGLEADHDGWFVLAAAAADDDWWIGITTTSVGFQLRLNRPNGNFSHHRANPFLQNGLGLRLSLGGERSLHDAGFACGSFFPIRVRAPTLITIPAIPF
jgi:hypothetical protein